MIERVVYVLGAGFSAPLGLPVTANFLAKSKDLFAAKPHDFQYFRGIYSEIDRLHVVKGTYAADLHNIEEVLSLLEMEALLKGADQWPTVFTDFIRDVIVHFTPLPRPYGSSLPLNWEDHLFGGGPTVPYSRFAAQLSRLEFSMNRQGPKNESQVASRVLDLGVEYGIVTLNYDRVIENSVEFLNNSYGTNLRFGAGPSELILKKLHGSVDGERIVPPTWNKALHPEITNTWQAAYHVLSHANQIRFIGYSLPEGDAYLRYLLKAAMASCRHLRAIDVLCLDPGGAVQRRYHEFIEFPNFRFMSTDVSFYLGEMNGTRNSKEGTYTFQSLEQQHASFFAA